MAVRKTWLITGCSAGFGRAMAERSMPKQPKPGVVLAKKLAA